MGVRISSSLIDAALFRATHAQLEDNRSRARQGRGPPRHLLQGLMRCANCGYAYYGKTTRQLLAGRRVKDFRYYRCSGSDGYRFGGERVCSNTQVQGKFVETAVWQEVCDLLSNPQRLEREYQDRNMAGAALEHVETLKAQRAKLERVLERLIDSFAVGLIEKNQFTPRMERTKNRVADLDIRIKAEAGDIDSLENLPLATKRLKELAVAVGPDLANAEWHRKREIIRRLVQQIDIGQEIITIHFRVAQNARASDSISV